MRHKVLTFVFFTFCICKSWSISLKLFSCFILVVLHSAVEQVSFYSFWTKMLGWFHVVNQCFNRVSLSNSEILNLPFISIRNTKYQLKDVIWSVSHVPYVIWSGYIRYQKITLETTTTTPIEATTAIVSIRTIISGCFSKY